MSARARRVGDYVMTEAKQARLKEIAQLEREREYATSLAQKGQMPTVETPDLEVKLETVTPPTSEPMSIPRTRRTRTKVT